MNISLHQAAGFCGGRILGAHGAEASFNGVSYDSRNVLPGQLFVAIRGERSDGHDYAPQAVQNGAAAVLAERDPFEGSGSVPVILVPDSVKALGSIAHACRMRFPGKVIGLTGTAGKTTTKELLASILSQGGKTARTPLNLNTQVGLPVSILAASGDERFWVLEAGISHPWDMEELGAVMEPDLAIVLNAGTGHSLGLGDKGTAFYKTRLLRHRKPGCPALVCADYEDLVREASAFPDVFLFSSRRSDVPFHASYAGINADGHGMYSLTLPGASFDVETTLTGQYAAENIIAAAAAAHLLGLTAEDIMCGIRSAALPGQRFARREIPGWTIIDDSYNANPLSTSRMLQAASELAPQGGLVCVMGEMGELGSEASREHVALGQNIAGAGCSALFWFGGHAGEVQEGLADRGYTGYFHHAASHADFLGAFRRWKEGSSRGPLKHVILFKGSRMNRLEQIVKLFIQEEDHAV
jgi:UDP-N-acetylmuramoyl-tripeptide--D-alanyl-D-alanine ligase